MAIENKWSRQCLLPSKDPTADEVEIAWCGLLVFLCRFLWGCFFSLFLEYIKRKKISVWWPCVYGCLLLSHSWQLHPKLIKCAVYCCDASRSCCGEQGKVSTLRPHQFSLLLFPPTPCGTKQEKSLPCSVMGLLWEAFWADIQCEGGAVGRLRLFAAVLLPKANFAFPFSTPGWTWHSYAAYLSNAMGFSGHRQ